KLVGHDDSIILTGCLVFVHNCIFESEPRRKSLVTSGSGMCILQRLLDRAETLLEDESTQNFELIYAIFARIMESDLFPLLFDSLNSPLSLGQSLARRQITLLKLLDSKLFSSDSSNISLYLCTHLLQVFDTICPQVIFSMQQANIVDRENQPQEIEDTSILYTGLVLLLQCFGKLSQDGDDRIRECLFKGGIIASTLLAQADKTFPRVTKAASSPSLQQGISEFAYIKRDIIRVIGNMAYDNCSVQDEVRRLGGISLVLNQCNIDDNNPYIREHAIFALRNLLINNSENQKLVKELEPIAPVQNDVLSEIGIRTELGND
ncbi:29294_t:CDS:2, partial [Racocetra persica]